MCDPTVLAVASTVAGIAGQGYNMYSQNQAQNEQTKAYNSWQQQEQRNKQLEAQRQDELRQKSSAAVDQATTDLGAQNTQAAQADEQARLNAYLKGQGPASTSTPLATDPKAPTSVADMALSGEYKGGPSMIGDQFETELAKQLHNANASVSQRIGAMATLGSYGGSFGGIDNRNAGILAKSGSAIDVANNLRKASLGAFGTEQAVNPLQIGYTPSPVGDLSSMALGFGSQGLGKMFAGSATTPTGKATTAPKIVGPNLPAPAINGNINYGVGGGAYLY
jgi:hypothetical protein